MPTLTISGNGKSILFKEIDEETAERYAELGAISEEIYEEFESNCESESGFFESADVYMDDKHIGTVEEIIELGEDSPDYKLLQELFLAPEIGELKNAFVENQFSSGTFLETEIPDYPDVNSKLSPDFIKDFMQNICVATGGLYGMESWDGEGYEEDIGSDGEDTFVIFNGKQHICIVDDETFLGDEDE